MNHHQTEQVVPQQVLSRLTLPQSGGGLESLRAVASPTMKIKDRLDAARQALMVRAEQLPGIDRDVIERLLRDGEAGLLKLEQERDKASLQPAELFGLEAVIESDGSRPVLFVQDGMINLGSPDLASELSAPWRVAAEKHQEGIRKVVRSVGAIQLPGFDNARIGTGFAVAPGLILTNRHVLEEVAHHDNGQWVWRYDVAIDFQGELDRPGESVFPLDAVVRCGPDRIARQINFAHLDYALIKIRDERADFPPALAFEGEVDAVRVAPGRATSIYAVGFPAKPDATTAGPGPGLANGAPPIHEYEEVITRLFKNSFGSKRWAPGYVDAGAGQLKGDQRRWVMSHDASTLAGSSGSCVVDFSDKDARVVGLHFGGRPRVENWAHVMAALRAQFDGLELQWHDAQ